MTPEQAIQAFDDAGLKAALTPERACADISVIGDFVLHSGILGGRWACYLRRHEDLRWSVVLPPYWDVEPWSEFFVSSLEDAVSLTIFAFPRRLKESDGEFVSVERRAEYTQQIYLQW